jgi:hypothetical protein
MMSPPSVVQRVKALFWLKPANAQNAARVAFFTVSDHLET